MPIISVENLSKAYRIGVADEKHDTLAATVASWVKAPLHNLKRLSSLDTTESLPAPCSSLSDIHWALRDLSFEVNEGEVVGIIGHNGAGKSTLLKILSRITDPTSGRAVIRGRVSSLLEVGTGFHPELSGRDNIYMNGTILGMRKREIDRKFYEIVSFSGVEKFIDTPVKRYSSGMKVRLAFSVAAHLEPEILIIDEVLAVGDQEFQNRCLGKMKSVASSGRTVLFVSHNMGAVQSLCTECMILKDGTKIFSGKPQEAISVYLRTKESIAHAYESQNSDVSLPIGLKRVWLTDMSGAECDSVMTGAPLTFCVKAKINSSFSIVEIALGIYNPIGDKVLHLTSKGRDQCFRFDSVTSNEICFDCVLSTITLAPSDYTVNVYVSCDGQVIEYVKDALSFRIVPSTSPGFSNCQAELKCPIVVPQVWIPRPC